MTRGGRTPWRPASSGYSSPAPASTVGSARRKPDPTGQHSGTSSGAAARPPTTRGDVGGSFPRWGAARVRSEAIFLDAVVLGGHLILGILDVHEPSPPLTLEFVVAHAVWAARGHRDLLQGDLRRAIGVE